MVPRRLATTIHAHCRAKLKTKAWYFGTWNVRSLVDNEGTVKTVTGVPELVPQIPRPWDQCWKQNL